MALSTTQYGYIIDPMVPFTDDKGKTIKDGFVRVFVAGSSTPVVTYRNFDGATNQDLIELDSSGRTMTSVIGSKGFTYKVCVYDLQHSQESPILTVDKVSVIGANITAGAGATVVTGLDGLTTKPDGFVDASVIGTDGYVALDHTLVTDDLDTDAKVTAVEEDRYVTLLNDDVNAPDSKMTLGRLWQWVLGKIKSLSTTITSFRTGDYIAVDGPDGTAKMSKDDLLKETAENALAGNVAEEFSSTKNYLEGKLVVYGGKNYRFILDHTAGAWDDSEVQEIPVDLYALCLTQVQGDKISSTRIGNYGLTSDAQGMPVVASASSYNLYYFAVEAGKVYNVKCFATLSTTRKARSAFYTSVPTDGATSAYPFIANTSGRSETNSIFMAPANGYVAISVYGSGLASIGVFPFSSKFDELDSAIALKANSSLFESETKLNGLADTTFAYSQDGYRLRYGFVIDGKSAEINIQDFPSSTYRFSIQTTNDEEYAMQGGSGTKIWDSGWKTTSDTTINVPSGKGKYALVNVGFTGADAPISSTDKSAVEASTKFYVNIAGGAKLEEIANLAVDRVNAEKNTLANLTKSIVASGKSVMSTGKSGFWTYFGCDVANYQSTIIDLKRKKIFLFAAQTSLRVFDFDGKLVDTITKTLLTDEHDNDACQLGNTIYLAGGKANGGASHSKFACKYDIDANTTTAIDVSAITDGLVGFRCIVACFVLDESTIVFACNDTLGNEASDLAANFADEKLAFYKMDVSTEVITPWFSVDWNSGYLQGATFVDGKIYAISNIIEGQGSLTGARCGACLWIIDPDTQTTIDQLYFEEEFEPEGLEFTIENGDVYLWTGFGGASERFLMKCKV